MAKKKVKSKPKQPPKPSITDNISSEVIAAAYSSATQPVFMKVCRLCESKDGPFLNIFDADKVTAKKIDELMPFGIAENDDLPHKICFRCSAKLEELYEFIQKCIKTQESLRTAIGKTGPFLTKTKTRKAWEEKLNKTNMSNDDICDALIKKAMEGIKDIPLKPLPTEDASPPPTKRVTRRTDLTAPKKESSDTNDSSEVKVKQAELTVEKNDVKPLPTKTNKPNNSEATQSSNNKKTENVKTTKQSESKEKNVALTSSLSFDYLPETKSNNNEEANKKLEKPFNIMDHVSMIKVYGVGVLFQCKLCNRNFLLKEVVESHACAKNGKPKVEIPKTVPVPEPPKIPTVKYIKMDGDMKKPNSWTSYRFENDPSTDSKNRTDFPITDKTKSNDESSVKEKNSKHEDSTQSAPIVKPKPRIGPASKTRRLEAETDSGISSKDSQDSQTSNSQSPSVHIPSVPNLNGRYKLVPGPNNIFTLVEDSSVANQGVVKETPKTAKKRRSELEALTDDGKSKDQKKDSYEKSKSPEVVDLADDSKPYPVGLFQTVGHSSRLYEPSIAPPPTPFTTPAMKKQSYTIVQTGNPSKLLISTKAQAQEAEVPKKRPRKSKPEPTNEMESKEPFKVTLEDVAHPKDSGFFTFINVDPLLQPSYVLPTDNIIQESQISTSTAIVQNAAEGSKESKDKDKYACNMCGESFSREKKLLAHIQSHYTKMDEEDQIRAEKTSSKKKSRKQ